MRSSVHTVAAALLVAAATSFTFPPARLSERKARSLRPVTRPGPFRAYPTATAAKKGGAEARGEDPNSPDLFGPLYVLGPLAVVAQISFLVAAKLVCGSDNLHVYGDLGNAYIRENTDYATMTVMERYEVQTRGQQIWYDNVFRDLRNGGPVKPPISTYVQRD